MLLKLSSLPDYGSVETHQRSPCGKSGFRGKSGSVMMVSRSMMTSLTEATPPNGYEFPSTPLHGGKDSGHASKRVGAQSADKLLRTRVALVDDDRDLHLFLSDLGSLGHFQLARPCYSGAEALERLPEDPPDVVIMDIRLPDMSGIDCTTKLRAILPELPIIMLTGFPDSQAFFRSLMGGAKGFLVKPVLPQELLTAIDDVLKGEFALGKQVVPFLIQLVQQVGQVTQAERFSRREEQILACLFEGMQDKEIASALGIGTATVHTHMHRLFEKLGVHSRREIIAKFLALI